MVLIEIKAGTARRDWLKIASRTSRKKVEEAGLAWIDAHILVKLPERGRCYTKAAGHVTLVAHG